MSNIPVIIYNQDQQPVLDLGDTFDVQYTKRLNEVWSASFALPADNDKTDSIDLMSYAEIYDGDKRVGLFRIDERYPERQDSQNIYRYECSHVLDTLNDDYLALEKVPEEDDQGNVIYDDEGNVKNWVNITKSGTENIINWILDQQSTTNWQLGQLDFEKSYEYEFYQQTLLKALLNLPKPWWEDYELTFDTISHPWTLNLVKPDTTPRAELNYRHNIQSIEKEENAKDLITELYAYGEGSGNDRVSVGPLASDPAGYGTHVGIWEEQFFDNEADLNEAAQKYLDYFDTPKTSYRGNAVDIFQKTETNEINLGEYVEIHDEELGLDNTVRVTEKSKNDVTGDPGTMRVELNNKTRMFPDYGTLAFKDEATEDNLASNSVSGGTGGALAGGGVGNSSLANEAVSWDKVQFKTEDGYFEQSLMKINSIVEFTNDFTEIDKLKDGETYAKMRKDWRSASDITKIAGGEIFTDSVDLDRINFSPTASKNIVGQINANDNGLTIDTDVLDIVGSTSINLASDGTISFNAPNVDITSLNDDGNWGSRITANEDQISLNVSDIDDNEASISINADQIQTNVSDIDGNSSQITQNADQIQTNVSDIDGNSSQITQNADEIDIRVKEGEVMSYINVTGAGIDINANDELELRAGGTINIDATNGVEVEESAINLEAGQINITGTTTLDSWQYETSTTIDGGQVEANTLNITDINVDGNIDMEGVNAITGAEFVGGSGTRWTFFGSSIQPNANITMGGYGIKNGGVSDFTEATIGNVTIKDGKVDGVDVSEIDTSGYTDSDAVNAIETEMADSNPSISSWKETNMKPVTDLNATKYTVQLADGSTQEAFLLDEFNPIVFGDFDYISHDTFA